jgi:hypothetical protein
MAIPLDQSSPRWCIVISDEYGADAIPQQRLGGHRAPAQYRHLGVPGTMLQRALHRAATIVPADQVMITADEQFRDCWEKSFGLVRPARRFIGVDRRSCALTAAAAVLYAAAQSDSSVVVLLPARSYVAHESVLRRAISQALSELPRIPEGVATLGMLDLQEPVDEDFLIVGTPPGGAGLKVRGIARRPIPAVVRQLRWRGALVASGIMVGYAKVFADHIARSWPKLQRHLRVLIGTSGEEYRVPNELRREIRAGILRSMPWHPAFLPQRVVAVSCSGWSGLKSPRAVAQITQFLGSIDYSRAAEPIAPQAAVLRLVAPKIGAASVGSA